MKENLAQMNKVFNLYRSVKGSDNGYKNGKDVEWVNEQVNIGS